MRPADGRRTTSPRPSCRSSRTVSRNSRGRRPGSSSPEAKRRALASCTEECDSRRTTRSPLRPMRASSSRRTRCSTSTAPASTPKEEGASILVVQTADEIAAITMATGAALTGTRSATATSGPGFSLMMEGIGWASINEVPVVITLYQRAGPSTGMPTRHEQGDLRFALHAGHGESPRILLASGDFEECIRDGLLAFNYADRYQMPVIHLVDKALANSYATTPVPDLSDLRIDRGALALENNGYSKDNPYQRFDLSNGPVSPRAFLGQEGTISCDTGDEHEERAHNTEDEMVRNAMMEKPFAELVPAANDLPRDVKLRYFGPKDAATVIVSWRSE